MSKQFSQFPDGTTPLDTDRFLIGRADPSSPSGFSNFIMTWLEIKVAVGGGGAGTPGANGLTIPGNDGEDGQDGISIPGIPGKDGIGTPGVTGRDGSFLFPNDPDEPDSPIIIPGPQGLQGTTGSDGKIVFLPADMDEPDSPIMIPGPPGIAGIGTSGTSGKDGQIIFGEDGLDGNDGFSIPGTPGLIGLTGPVGPIIWLPSYNDDPEEPMPVGIPFSDNMVYLGEVTGAAVTVGPLSWQELFDLIYWEYNIGGYNGGGPIGRMLCANGAITTVGLTNGNTLIENITLNQTSVSKPGIPLAVTASAIARSGWGYIRGRSGELKQIDITGMSGNPAVATAPTSFSGRSFFSDLGTNGPIKNMQLSVYDTLITTALSAQTFTAPTRLRAWGIRKGQK